MGAENTATAQDVMKIVGEHVSEKLAGMIGDFRKEVEGMVKAQGESFFTQRRSTEDAAISPADKRGFDAAAYVRALAAGKGDPERAAKIAKQLKMSEGVIKALELSSSSAGGALVPQEFASEVIDLLTARAVVRKLGASSVPMENGNLTMPYLAGAATAAYVGEGANIPKSQQSFGQLQMSAKKLAALVPISNDLLRTPATKADGIVRNDLVRALQLREDLAFIRDDGTSSKPKGLRYTAQAGNVFNATQAGASVTLAEATSDLSRAIEKLESLDVPMLKPGWIFTPRIKWALMALRDGNGNYVFRTEMLAGTLLGFPFATTTQVPNNLGAGTNESEIYLADFDSLIIAEATDLEISVYEGGTYHDGTGLVSGISADQTVMRCLARHDFGARFRGYEVAVITGVKWKA